MFTAFYAVLPTLLACMLFPAAFVLTGELSVSSDALSSIISAFASVRAFAAIDLPMIGSVLVCEATRTANIPSSTTSTALLASASHGVLFAVLGAALMISLTACLVLSTGRECSVDALNTEIIVVDTLESLSMDTTFTIPEAFREDALFLETPPFTINTDLSFSGTESFDISGQLDGELNLFDLSLPAIPLSTTSSFGRLIDFCFDSPDDSVVIAEASAELLAEPAPFTTFSDIMPTIADASFFPSEQAYHFSAILELSFPVISLSTSCSFGRPTDVDDSVVITEADTDLLAETAPFSDSLSFEIVEPTADGSFLVPEQVHNFSAVLDVSLSGLPHTTSLDFITIPRPSIPLL